eukprot:1273633-Rhodomonas_salina.1
MTLGERGREARGVLTRARVRQGWRVLALQAALRPSAPARDTTHGALAICDARAMPTRTLTLCSQAPWPSARAPPAHVDPHRLGLETCFVFSLFMVLVPRAGFRVQAKG